MRRGFNPFLSLTKKGEIFAIVTGSDATAEHENGSERMQSMACSRAANGSDCDLIKDHRAGKKIQYPQLLDRKKMDKNLNEIRFIEGVVEGKSAAAIVFDSHFDEKKPLGKYRELMFGYKDEVAGAWDESSFAFMVSGEKMIEKLKVFHGKLQTGDGLFAGTFLKNLKEGHISGVVIALESELRPEHHQKIKEAQLEYEVNIRLKSGSRVTELEELSRSKNSFNKDCPGYMWPIWKDRVADSEIVYGVNPYNEKSGLIPYFGPYEFEDLKKWILAEEKFKLTPYRGKEISTENSDSSNQPDRPKG